MSQLVESIKILNGRCYNLALHESRLNRSRFEVFGISDKCHLMQYIQVPEAYSYGLVKCRVIYDSDIREITYSHYQIRKIQSVKIVETENLNYEYKWIDRSQLDELFNQRCDADEIIIVNNGLVTDGYYYNLVFEKDGRFFTPKTPLLHGIQRASLFNKGKIEILDILGSDIAVFDKVHYINALTPLGKIVVDIRNVIR
jgi:4-amino-4-deoxychorismate lyase